MEISIKFDPSVREEVNYVGLFSAKLSDATDAYAKKLAKEEPGQEAKDEETPDAPAEEKPVRRPRRKKEEPTPAPEPEAKEEADAPQSAPEENDLPFEVDEPKAEDAPAHGTATADEFAALNHAKREALGLVVGGKNAALIKDFNRYCQTRSEIAFGNRKPSQLPGQQLYEFCEWFKTIELNPDYVKGSVDEDKADPFVSAALSDEIPV